MAGQHRNSTNEILYFTDAFFHRRAEIRDEMESAGFEVVAQLPIEGLGILARDLIPSGGTPASEAAAWSCWHAPKGLKR